MAVEADTNVLSLEFQTQTLLHFIITIAHHRISSPTSNYLRNGGQKVALRYDQHLFLLYNPYNSKPIPPAFISIDCVEIDGDQKANPYLTLSLPYDVQNISAEDVQDYLPHQSKLETIVEGIYSGTEMPISEYRELCKPTTKNLSDNGH